MQEVGVRRGHTHVFYGVCVTYLKKNLAVIAAVDRTLVLVFKLSMSSMTRLTREFGLIESFGSILVIEPIEKIISCTKR